MRWLALLVCVALLGCLHTETLYTIDERGNPVVLVRSENFMRVGQGIQDISFNRETPGTVTISQITLAEAVSEELKQMWGSLNRTAQLGLIGAVLGAAAGNPAAGGLIGAATAQVEKAIKRPDPEKVKKALEILEVNSLEVPPGG